MIKGFNNYCVSQYRRDEECMRLALQAAERATLRGDEPIGAVLSMPKQVLIDSNTVWSENDLTNHAEINVIKKASQVGFHRLRNAVLYCTVEPCAMCAAVAKEYGIKEIVFGAYNEVNGFSTSKIFNMEQLPISFRGGILAKECRDILPAKLQEHTRESL